MLTGLVLKYVLFYYTPIVIRIIRTGQKRLIVLFRILEFDRTIFSNFLSVQFKPLHKINCSMSQYFFDKIYLGWVRSLFF